MKTLKKKLYIGLTAMTLAIAGSVYAQITPPAPPAPDAHAGHHETPGDKAKWADKMKDRMAKHQAELHDKLKITAAQEPAWKTFTDGMNPGAMPARPDHKELEKMTTPERLEKGLDRAKEHLAQMQTRLSALKTFYAVLTPEQQKIFDDSHRRMEKNMHERMSDRMHGHGPMNGDKKP